MYSYMKMENETCWNFPGVGGGGIMENDGGSEFNYDVLKELL
jgi:hypothetical protein